MKPLLVALLILSSLVACSDSPTAPSPQPTQPTQTEYTLSVVVLPAGAGSVGISPNRAQHNSGTTVTLTASPAPGYQFSEWRGYATGSTDPTSVVMDSNKTVTAVFTATQQLPGPHTLLVFSFPPEGGTVAISPNQEQHDSGTTVTLTASPAPGYQFSEWMGHASGSTNPTSVFMDTNYTVTAWFTATPQQSGPPALAVIRSASARWPVLKSQDVSQSAAGTAVTLTALYANQSDDEHRGRTMVAIRMVYAALAKSRPPDGLDET